MRLTKCTVYWSGVEKKDCLEVSLQKERHVIVFFPPQKRQILPTFCVTLFHSTISSKVAFSVNFPRNKIANFKGLHFGLLVFTRYKQKYLPRYYFKNTE